MTGPGCGQITVRDPSAWRWREGTPDRTGLHFVLTHEKTGDKPIAVVGPTSDSTFPVALSRLEELEPEVRDSVLTDVRRELDFYLLEVGDPNPWAYVLYHCRTSANLYSRVHWSAHGDAASSETPSSAPASPGTDEGVLSALVARAWRLWQQSADAPKTATVRPSMPILYFGDRNAYAASPFRILTVGLNPSLAEFPTDTPWRRFPHGEPQAGRDGDQVASRATCRHSTNTSAPTRTESGSTARSSLCCTALAQAITPAPKRPLSIPTSPRRLRRPQPGRSWAAGATNTQAARNCGAT